MTMNNQDTRYNDQIITNDQCPNKTRANKTRLNNKFDLEERTTEFARSVIRLCKKLPRSPVNDRLVSQAVSSGGSVGANYREANDALGKRDFLHRMKIARREAKECHHWLQLLVEANERLDREFGPIIKEAMELKKILSAIVDRSQ